ncbi:MAG: HAD family hydrolase [Psittacicella sp.]
MNKAIFLDRDGTINIDVGYNINKDKFIFIDGVLDSLKYFIEKGYYLFIVTNQSGIGRGYFSSQELKELHNWMEDILKQSGIYFKDILICPHLPEDNCDCRKPSSKLIDDACHKFSIVKKDSFMVGDKLSDCNSGINANLGYNFLIESTYTSGKATSENIYKIKSLLDLKGFIESL